MVVKTLTNFKVGDIVARKSYGEDVFFKITCIEPGEENNIITLKGITYRLEADAIESDLVVQSDKQVREYRNRCCMGVEKNSAFCGLPGKIKLKKRVL